MMASPKRNTIHATARAKRNGLKSSQEIWKVKNTIAK